MKSLSSSGIALLKKLEGLSLVVYKDSAGKWSIGYGHLIKDDEQIAAIITEAEAEALLLQDVAQAVSVVNKVPFVTAPNQNQFDALVIFVFNIGVYNFNKSTMRKILTGQKGGGVAEAAKQFDVWNKVTINGQKKIVQGLVNRRKAERALFEA